MITKIQRLHNNTLIITSYPFWLCVFVCSLLATFWGYAFFHSSEIDTESYLIFNFVCIVFLMVPQYRKTIFSKQNNTCQCISKRLWFLDRIAVPLKEIKAVEVQCGVGMYSGSCSLYVKSDDAEIIIADSDISIGSKDQIKKMRKQLEVWLEG